MNQISISEFKNLVDRAKALKSHYLIFNNNGIYGADETMFILKRSNIDTYGINITTTSILLLDFYKNSVEVGSEYITIENNCLSSIYGKLNSLDENITANIAYGFKSLSNYINLIGEPTISIINLRDIEKFNKIQAMKAADGTDLLIVEDTYPITLSSNMLPLNKSDKIGLYIYDLNDGTFISYFTIKKPKQLVEIFIRYIKLR